MLGDSRDYWEEYESDQLLIHNEEMYRNYETAESFIYNDFKQWYLLNTNKETFSDSDVLEFSKTKLTVCDNAVICKTIDGWREFECIQKLDEGYKFIL
jgi:hypothetical protein